MDKTTKIILIVLACVIVCCICATITVFAAGLTTFGIFRNETSSNVHIITEEAVRVGAEIVDYQVPAGYSSSFSLHIGDITVIGNDSPDNRSHIILAQFPDNTSVDFEKILKMIQQASNNPGSRWYDSNMKTIDRIPVTINGQDTTLTINEGQSSDGISYRMASAEFQGRGGPAVLIIAGPTDEWDMQMVDQLILSTN